MSRSISASVGRMGGKNLPDDVITVQQLLDQVPLSQGGPMPLLEVDGLCGPKTINAIQRFQLHHFGWAGADGRVDTAGPTLAKLNEFDSLSTRVPGPVPITMQTVMRCPHGGRVLAAPVVARTVLTTSDTFLIGGCLLPTPCIRVIWSGPPGRSLTTRSVGTCVNAFGNAQGSVTIL